LAPLALLALCHCASKAEEPSSILKTTSAAVCVAAAAPVVIVGGTETSEHRAIGEIDLPPGWVPGDTEGRRCTATLIRPRVVLTAAHCLGFSDQKSTGIAFYAGGGGGARNKFMSDKTRVFSGGVLTKPGPKDVAILRLATAVPAKTALPIDLAARWPSAGTTMTLYGFGCTSRADEEDAGVKRKLSFPLGNKPGVEQRNDVCRGDSGGPLIDDKGLITGVASGFVDLGTRGFGPDYYGDVVALRAEILEAIAGF